MRPVAVQTDKNIEKATRITEILKELVEELDIWPGSCLTISNRKSSTCHHAKESADTVI